MVAVLMLHLLVDDGTIATTWWPLADMARFCSRIGSDVRRSVDADSKATLHALLAGLAVALREREAKLQ
jgi:hypothetical protein